MKKNKQFGFTLVELLIVIAIMGILATVSYINLNQIKGKARDAKRILEIKQIQKALNLYYNEYDHYPYFANNAYADEGDWDNYELADNWGDFLDKLYAENYLTGEKITVSGGSGNVNITIQDPAFEWGNDHLYQYMPSKTPVNLAGQTLETPDNFRIRVKLENKNNPVLLSSLDGAFLYSNEFSWSDNETYKENSCTAAKGYYCVGPQDNFSAFVSGKPVIYLYPTEKTEVTVKVNTKKITESIPNYNDGWDVMAYPDGTIIDSEDGKTYPYLFWEGPSYKPFVDRAKGFVIKSNEAETFLAEKLAAQGLEEKEYTEFIKFWAPRMKNKDYVYVYFMPQADYNKLIPMDISPQPDTIIRTYMLFKSLDEPIEVEPQILTSPIRKGFTVVEWGGDLKEIK